MRQIALLAVPLLAASASAQMSVSAVRETQKIRPADAPPAPARGAIALSCAQNEFCAFQVEVSAPASGALTVSDVSLGNLAGPGGATLSGGAALVYTEGFLNVTMPSNGAGATGEWPDPLVPKVDDFYGEARNALPVTVPAGQNQPFFVELHVPPGQAAGAYAGTATVTASDGSTASLAVTIQVRGFALPSTASLGSAYGFGWDGPCIGHFGGYGGSSCDDAQLEALNAIYFRDALNHRLTISAMVYAPPISDGSGSWATFDGLYGPFLQGEALGGADQLQGAAVTALAFTAKDQQPATYAAWAQHFKAQGWFGKLFDYTCDEPPRGCAWSDITTRAANAHAGDPAFRTLVTTSLADATANGVLSSIDILVPVIDAMYDPASGSQRGSYDAFLQQPNASLWMYQSCLPSSSCSAGSEGGQTGWPTMFVDEAAITNRIMQWMDWTYQVSTELYYETTYAMEVGNAWQSQYAFGNNGDGSIWYPGKPSVIGGTHDIPVESFRMKMLRGGMQDYEYLHLLDTLGDHAFAQAQAATVVGAANSFTSDPGVLEAARLAMAAEIEKDMGVSQGGTSGGGGGGATATSGGGSAASSGTGGSTGPSSGDGAASSGTGGWTASRGIGGSRAGAGSWGGSAGNARGSTGGGRASAGTAEAGTGTGAVHAGAGTTGPPNPPKAGAAGGSCGCTSPASGQVNLDGLLVGLLALALRAKAAGLEGGRSRAPPPE